LTNSEVVLTPEGYKKLLDELDYLIKKRRREIAERIKESIEFGELAENPEYNDAKNEQAFVEGRIAQINELLAKAKVIRRRGAKTDRVVLGSRVTLRDLETGEEEDYLLVGSVEADPSNHRISNESPVGKAIIGKKPGEIVRVEVPTGYLEYEVVKIKKK